ncbi:MAG: hypothetical protein HP494_19470, partial [Nitrospira sp.]|nr:hypothetical protein [Nitrospira sp.]
GTWYGNARKEMAAIGEAVRANREMTFDRCHRLAEDLVTLLATSDDLILRMMREDAEAYQVTDVPPS